MCYFIWVLSIENKGILYLCAHMSIYEINLTTLLFITQATISLPFSLSPFSFYLYIHS